MVLFGVAVSLFGEPFHVWSHPLSALGALRTPGGYPNEASSCVYTALMWLNGLYFFGLGAKLRSSSGWLQKQCSRLSLLTAFGMVISSAPHDMYHNLHAIGTGTAVFGLLMMNTLAVGAFRFTARYRLLVAVNRVQWAVLLVYAALYTLDVPAKQTAQKPAAFMLLLSTLLVSEFFVRPVHRSAGKHRVEQPSSVGS
ncbi:MAG: hypothetical protein ACQEQU_05285 [Spirochaetota bacterium]